jgi:hypothetical protein
MQLFRGLEDDAYSQSKSLRNKLFTIPIYISNPTLGRELYEAGRKRHDEYRERLSAKVRRYIIYGMERT